MAFNTQNFIFLFLPAFLLSYYLASVKFKNAIILIYSILYYVIGNFNSKENIVILFLLILTNYIFLTILLNLKKNNRYIYLQNLIFIIDIIFNILILCLFKLNIFTTHLPLGVSFYTFHFIILFVHVHKTPEYDKVKLDFSFYSYSEYILFFPKLLSGPIVKYDAFKKNLDTKKVSFDYFIDGIFLFSVGLSLKCLLSDNISYIVNQIETFGYESISIGTAWVGMYSYTMRLYFDFAGYSLMAIGISKAIGIDIPENFNLPFCSKSISTFWRRWHITLSNFFRDYVYIPLGGNCNNKNILRQIFNLIIVWLLTGIWHGFAINYLLWALLICFVIILEKTLLNKIYDKCEIIGRLIVIILMPLFFLIFSIPDINKSFIYLNKLLSIDSLNNTNDFFLIVKLYWKIFIIGILFLTKYPKVIMEEIKNTRYLKIVVIIVLIALSTYMINISNTDTFKYFSF